MFNVLQFCSFFFFFQAEDGIRDKLVTGVQTCALPIYLVRGIVSLDGGPAEAATTRGFRRAIQLAPWIKLFGGERLVRAKVRHGLIAASGDTTWVTEQVVDGYTAGAARDLDGTLKAYLAMAQAREGERLAPHLGEIRCPVRLVVGTVGRGSGVSPAEVATLAGLLRSFAVDTVPGAGHFIYEEQPAAVVAAVQRLPSGDGAPLARPAAP